MVPIVRTLIVSLVASGLLIAGYFGVLSHTQSQRNAELERLNREMEARLREREAWVERLGRATRMAHVLVREQSHDADGAVLDTTFDFIELDDHGGEIARQTFTVPGAVVYIDSMTVRFDPEDIARGHPLRGHTLVLFRRVFSEALAPRDGFAIDTPGAAPPAYAVAESSRFEQQLWGQFWDVARDRALARSLGVRVAQGEAVYQEVRPGDRFEFVVEAAGGTTLVPLEAAESATHGALSAAGT